MPTAFVETPTHHAELDAERIADLRATLVAQRAVQLDLAFESEATAAEFGGQGSAGSLVGRELAGASGARARQTVEEVVAALDRMDRGTYGSCERCAASIPLERLEAVPHARFCVRCAESGGTPLG
jgi:RNA polymerase-binding transcription factor DksA